MSEFPWRPPSQVWTATEALYRSMTTEWLVAMRSAFLFDIEQEADRRFCQSRLDLIEAILVERGAVV